MTYLVEHEEEIYPRLAELGAKTRQTMETAFAQQGILARCTSYGSDVIPGSSLVMLHFPYQYDCQLDTPDDLFDPAVCGVTLREQALNLGEACGWAARCLKAYL